MKTVARRVLGGAGLIVITATAVAVFGPAPKASAHTLSPSASSNYRSVLTAITPELAGISMRVVDDGMHVELTNATPTPLILLGYSNEPYLRVDSGGVWENLHSPTFYLNGSSQPGLVYVPPAATATAVPLWQKVCACDTARWHDHRIHWGGTSPPPSVQAAPSQYHLIETWNLYATLADQKLTFTGDLSWVPGPSPAPWLLLAAASALAVVVAGVVIRWRVALPAALVVLVAVDVARAIGMIDGRSGSWHTQLQALPDDGIFTVIVWISALMIGVLIARGSVDALVGGALAGIILALISGLATLGATWHSQIVTSFPPDTERAMIALTVGLGTGVFAAGLLVFRRADSQINRGGDEDAVAR